MAFLYVLLTVICLGNSVVIANLGCGNARKSRMNFFILHLAVADLSVGLFSVVPDIAWRTTVAWQAGTVHILTCSNNIN